MKWLSHLRTVQHLSLIHILSLQQINAQFNNLTQLGFGFDALGNDLHAASVCVFHNILDPVSYTHLDVYKRQILCGLVGILGEKMQGTGLGDILAKSPSATVWAVAVAAVGYFIGSRCV